jgi:predicted metal-dependent HD superfamily phosphohydrolase
MELNLLVKDPVILSEISQLYKTPIRFYHTIDHINWMLKYSEKLFKNLEKPLWFDWAIVFHDIFYDTTCSDNEEQSIEIAKNYLIQLNKSYLIEPVTKAILATKSHHPTEDYWINLFLDLDQKILSESPLVYLEYAQNIKKEWKWVTSDLFIEGRLKFLKGCLETPIYITPEFSHFEEKARFNILNEISQLELI